MTFRRLLPILVAVGLLALAAPAAAQTADEIAAVQAWLNEQGYDAGPADGLMGSRTAGAIEEWQAERGWAVTGEVTPELVALATGGPGTAGGDDAGAGSDGGLSAAPEAEPVGSDSDGTASEDDAAVAAAAVTDAPIEGTGDLAFTELGDGALLVTNGIPWRPAARVPPRTIMITGHEFGLFTVSAASEVPVPLEGSVVELPGATFVPLMLALDRDGAARGSLADSPGVTWRFAESDLRFEFDGWTLTATQPEATIVFREDGVLLRGFELMAE